MERRLFLKQLLGAGAIYTAGGLPLLSSTAHASGFAGLAQPLLANLFLDGAPDFRHLMPPAYSSNVNSFGHQYWKAMAGAHGLAESTSAYETRWQNDFFHQQAGSTQFGILKSCGWLQRMWSAGNVAIICNTLASSSRNHALSIMVAEQGDRDTTELDVDRSGWGGRLAAAAGGNVVALTRSPRRFCYGPHQSDPAQHANDALLSARDMRALRLAQRIPGDRSKSSSIARSLQAYYTAKRSELSESSVYWRFLEHERKLRAFGEPLAQRFAAVPGPQPLVELADPFASPLANPQFGLQVRNLFDTIAASDLLNPRVVSMEYLNFDTHSRQREALEPHYADIFGDGGGLDMLWSLLPAASRSRLTFLIGGEFGRQIRANGDNGTDHGEGNIMLVIGENVAGGIYGEMFPDAELARLDEPGPQIEGKTGIERVYSALCDWVQSDSGASVIANTSAAPLEAGVDLSTLFT